MDQPVSEQMSGPRTTATSAKEGRLVVDAGRKAKRRVMHVAIGRAKKKRRASLESTKNYAAGRGG